MNSIAGDKPGSRGVKVQRWAEADGLGEAADLVVVEKAIALVYNGISHAVMMASPIDLIDLGCGFSLSEGIVETVDELYSISCEARHKGIEVAMEISARRFDELKRWRRSMMGVSGCGLCGAESLASAVRPTERKINACDAESISLAAVQLALGEFTAYQRVRAATGAIHAAAWCDGTGKILCAREDIGRHNAMDKVVGALAGKDWRPEKGFLMLSSRVSFELMQKAARLGIANVVAVSAASSLAIEQANAAGICLVGRAGHNKLTVYSDALRIEAP